MARTEQEILKDIRNVESALSPECLSCDGELSRSQTQAKYTRLQKQYRTLLKELGRTPTFEEIWGQLL